MLDGLERLRKGRIRMLGVSSDRLAKEEAHTSVIRNFSVGKSSNFLTIPWI